jgi:hypothetical protein
VTPRVKLFTAEGCSLCGPVLRRLESVRAELPFELEEIDITGVPALEAEYREWLPVVEIDGERAFVYRVDEDELRSRLSSAARQAWSTRRELWRR